MQSRKLLPILIACLCWLEILCLSFELRAFELRASESTAAESMTAIRDEQSIAVIYSLENSFDLSPYLETIEDPNSEYSLEDIEAGRYDHLWEHHATRSFIGKNTRSKYWYRLTIRWQGEQGKKSVLSLNYQPRLSCRLGMVLPPQENTPKQIIRTGYHEPFASRPISSLHYAFPLSLNSGQAYTLVGWVYNDNVTVPIQLPFILQSEAEFTADNQLLIGSLIAFYAAIGALLLYNLCLFFTLRYAMYGVYVIFLTSAALTCAYVDGITTSWWWQDQPLSRIRFANMNAVAMNAAYIAFVISALGGSKANVIYPHVIRWSVGLGVLCMGAIYSVNDLGISSAVAQLYPGIISIVTLVVIIQACKNRVLTASYLLLAEVMTMIGATTFMLMMNGILSVNTATLWSFHLGVAGEALLLSLALAERTRIAQQMAIDNLQKYETLYNNSIEGRFQIDLATNGLKCNTALARMFGYDHVDQLPAGRDFLQYLLPEDKRAITTTLAKDSFIQDYEVAISHPTANRSVWVSLTMQSLPDSRGNPSILEGSAIDISERMLKNEAQKEKTIAEKMQAVSEAKNKAKSQFFATMSHEFRTPLTSILGYAEIARRLELAESERIKHVMTIESSAVHMLQLINDVLDLSKIEAQKMEMQAIPVNLLHLVDEVKNIIAILAIKKAIAFTIDYQLPLPETFTSDPLRVKQALINLCSNAVKFTNKGGVTLKIACDLPQKTLRFSVKDTGVGLKQEQQDKLFKAFVQADSSTSRNFGGTGLGLHISKLIANSLGGDITVESEYEKGSVFIFSVATGDLSCVPLIDKQEIDKTEEPIEVTTTPEEQENNSILSADDNKLESKKIKVLLADDNEVNQTLIGFHLRQTGATVFSASDGIEALVETYKNDVDLILMDMDMPAMDGLTAVRYLRAKGLSTPIYALTGNTSAESIQECHDAGCDGYLSKPLETEKLKSIILSL